MNIVILHCVTGAFVAPSAYSTAKVLLINVKDVPSNHTKQFFVTLGILQSQFTEEGFKKTENSKQNVVLLLFVFTLDKKRKKKKKEKKKVRIIIIKMVISTVSYLADKGEHTTFYKIYKPQK